MLNSKRLLVVLPFVLFSVLLLCLAVPKGLANLVLHTNFTALYRHQYGEPLSLEDLEDLWKLGKVSLDLEDNTTQLQMIGALDDQIANLPALPSAMRKERLEEADRLLRRALGKAPAGTFIWSSLLMTSVQQHGWTEESARIWRISSYLSAYDPSVSAIRLHYAFAFWSRLTEEERKLAQQQLQSLAYSSHALAAPLSIGWHREKEFEDALSDAPLVLYWFRVALYEERRKLAKN